MERIDKKNSNVGLRRTHSCNELTKNKEGEEVILSGWVHSIRNLGKLIFMDLRDQSGLVQLVSDPTIVPGEIHNKVAKLHLEYVITVKGKVRARPGNMINPDMATGQIEVIISDLELENKSDPLPLIIFDEDTSPSEEIALKYRYLEMRRPSLKKKFLLRHKIILAIRNFFDQEGFLEIETPFLTRSTPEGARDYLVPSRVYPGTFYALPQSPQLFKQLLMISGYEKYFQIVKCFRDEDQRADRQPEFTQLDMEMAFPIREEILSVIERMMAYLFKQVLDINLRIPFKRVKYVDAMELYGSDKPDTRFESTILSVEDLFKETEFSLVKETLYSPGGIFRGILVPGQCDFSRKKLESIAKLYNKLGGQNLFWIKYTDSGINSSIKKFLNDHVINEIITLSGAVPGDLILLGLAKGPDSLLSMGQLRIMLAQQFNWIPDSDNYQFLWVKEFPLFETDKLTGTLQPSHHPFTSPMEEDLHLLDTDPCLVRADSYDLVLNGCELGSGSIRIHKHGIQNKIFELLGLSPEDASRKFGFFLEALQYGAPPHGGIALGMDRFVMILAGASSLRDVIAFPKTTSGACLMTGSPSPVDKAQLEELGLLLDNKKQLNK